MDLPDDDHTTDASAPGSVPADGVTPVDASAFGANPVIPEAEAALEESLFGDRREQSHPERFGRPGRPISRGHPFYVGFVGALGVITAWYLTQAVFSARQVIVIIAVSAFLAVGLNPIVEALIRRGMRRVAAVTIVFVGVIGFFLLFAVAIVPPIVDQSANFRSNAPTLLDSLQKNQTIARLEQDYGVITRAKSYVNNDLANHLFGGVVGVGRFVLGAVFAALTVLILTLYFLASLPSIKRQSYRLVPASRRERVALIGDEILLRVGGYVSGAFLVALCAGVSTLLFLLAIRLHYALALSLVVAVCDLVPLVGATVGAGVVTLLALTDSGGKALACVAFYVVYQQIENYFIYPRVMRRAVDVPPALTVMAALLGGALFGVVGALLAIPAAAAALLIVREVLVPRQDIA